MSLAGERDAAAVLTSPVRRRIVEVLTRVTDGHDQGQLTAAELGLHVSTVRFHLDQLVAVRLVEPHVRRQPGAGRPRKVYTSAPGSFAQLSRSGEVEALRLLSALLAKTLADRLVDRTPAEAGRRRAHDHLARVPGAAPATTPGQWLGRTAPMVEVLL